jgi:hypothetical protein
MVRRATSDLTITRRLLNIEVNTIIRDRITGEPMPPVPHALLDIADDYARALCDLRVNLTAYFAAPVPANLEEIDPGWLEEATPLSGEISNGKETFDRLRWAAKWASQHTNRDGWPMSTTDLAILDRIVNNADAIKEMFARFGPELQKLTGKTRAQLVIAEVRPGSYAIPPDDLILLQKIWDISTEQIVAQTVVHITGDVTTRVQQAVVGNNAAIAIHRQSVDVSVGCWKYLLDTVKEIAGATVKTLLGRV